MDRQNHYESAFEAFLRGVRMPYVAVDESKKALFAGSKLKSFDFVVYSKNGPNLLVDVKGRKAKDVGGAAPLQVWATRRDVDDLMEWERIFGDGFRAIFAYAFEIDPVLTPPPGHFAHRRGGGVAADDAGEDRVVGDVHGGGATLAAASVRHYLMLGVSLADFRQHMTRRSVKWDTVAMPAADFRRLARPVGEWL